IVLLAWRSLDTLDAARRWTAVGVRLAVLLIIVLMLAGLQGVRWHNDLAVIAVVDQSDSVRRFVKPPVQGPDAPPTVDEWINSIVASSVKQKRRDDRVGLVTFDGRPSVRAMPSVA